MPILPMFIFGAGLLAFLVLLIFAFSGPNSNKIQAKRLETVRERHSAKNNHAEAQMKRILAKRDGQLENMASRLIPKPDMLRLRLAQTGKDISLGKYAGISLGLFVIVIAAMLSQGISLLFALMVALFIGLGIPHFVIGKMISRRLNNFNKRFPDAIELLVRGLRSGLPISETLSVVATEVPDPVGVEFRSVVEKMKIGKTMEEALADTANRLATPEFKFFCITLAIQRETGGNLAETLSNLATVLRQRAQMKLKIKAMSSESKASAYIVGSLPFIVFTLIMMINPPYMMEFFSDERLMIAGGGGLVWMGIGAFMMAKMVNFEI